MSKHIINNIEFIDVFTEQKHVDRLIVIIHQIQNDDFRSIRWWEFEWVCFYICIIKKWDIIRFKPCYNSHSNADGGSDIEAFDSVNGIHYLFQVKKRVFDDYDRSRVTRSKVDELFGVASRRKYPKYKCVLFTDRTITPDLKKHIPEYGDMFELWHTKDIAQITYSKYFKKEFNIIQKSKIRKEFTENTYKLKQNIETINVPKPKIIDDIKIKDEDPLIKKSDTSFENKDKVNLNSSPSTIFVILHNIFFFTLLGCFIFLAMNTVSSYINSFNKNKSIQSKSVSSTFCQNTNTCPLPRNLSLSSALHDILIKKTASSNFIKLLREDFDFANSGDTLSCPETIKPGIWSYYGKSWEGNVKGISIHLSDKTTFENNGELEKYNKLTQIANGTNPFSFYKDSNYFQNSCTSYSNQQIIKDVTNKFTNDDFMFSKSYNVTLITTGHQKDSTSTTYGSLAAIITGKIEDLVFQIEVPAIKGYLTDKYKDLCPDLVYNCINQNYIQNSFYQQQALENVKEFLTIIKNSK